MQKHIRLLKSMNACTDAVEWCSTYQTPVNCWRYCQRADWLLWFAAKICVDRKLIVLAACDCAGTSLKYIKDAMLKKKAKVKEFRMYSSGFPESRKERDKFYWQMEKTGIFKQIFDNKEIIVRDVKHQ